MKPDKMRSKEHSIPTPERSDPYSLLRLFSLLSALSVVVILLLVGYGVYHIYRHEIIREAEQAAVSLGEAILAQERHLLLVDGPGGQARIQVARTDFARLDERMRNYLHPFRIYKIKVFSDDRVIVYSTDHAIIGQLDSGNAKLERVLRSDEVVSNLENKDQVRDLAGEQRFDVDVVETYLPIRAGGRIVGAFEIYVDVTAARARIFDTVALSLAVLFLVLLVVFAGLHVPMRRGALQLAAVQEELRRLASTDILTGLYNRRYVMTRACEEYSRMRRESGRDRAKATISFIMVDIDHFKRINDAYGHLVGDEILRSVAGRLRGATRDYDIIGRYWGEEFLIVLPGSGLEEARLAAERMRREVERTPIQIGERGFEITVSLGVSCAENGDVDELAAIARADRALYRAKHEGRNRVAWL
ncbi:MAG TPA: GGDEF domain-containing protein [Burkholderiales bacterium]|nr:GGDEF domain-containing protein [Burkholderiales bacterium]